MNESSVPGRVALRFLGTGASGGTPGAGRSHRLESSALATAERVHVLLDVTRDAGEQLAGVSRLDGVLLTHGHRDACGGVPALRRIDLATPVEVHASPETIAVIRSRYSRLDHCRFHGIAPGSSIRLGPWSATPLEVPHAREHRFRTYAWRVEAGGVSLVYASDVSRLTGELRQFASGADVLVLDGAMYGRGIFSHLRIEEAVPDVCAWDVGSVLLTQIGRTAPAHDRLRSVVAGACPRAAPAYDGMTLRV